MSKPPPPTRNGFTRPLHMQQLISWLGYFLEISAYILLILPCLTPTEQIGVSIPYISIFILYNICFLLASKETHRNAWISPKNMYKGFKCKWCDKFCDIKAKHCRACNLCRLDFDHHCFFLNNCVTKANYPLFLSGIILLGISSIFTSFLCIFVIMGNEYKEEVLLLQNNGQTVFAQTKGMMMIRAAEFYGVKKVPKAAVYVFLALLMFEMLGIQVFMIYLYALHALLNMRNISTFELISYRRQIEIEKDLMKK